MLRYQLVGSVLSALIVSTLSAQVSQGISGAEECAALADRIAHARASSLATRARSVDARFRDYPGSQQDLEKYLLSRYPCLAHQFPPERCGELQRSIDSTILGSSLGERLRLIFPTWTAGMRDKYAEMYVRTFCPNIVFTNAVIDSNRKIGAETLDKPTSLSVPVTHALDRPTAIEAQKPRTGDAAPSVGSKSVELAELAAATAHDAANAALRVRYAEALRKNSRISEARHEAETALALGGLSAEDQKTAERITTADAAESSVVSNSQLSDSELHRRTAILAMESGDYKIAVDEFQAVVKTSPPDSAVLYQLAQAQLKLQRYDDTIVTLKRALSVGFADPEKQRAAEDSLVLANYERLRSQMPITSSVRKSAGPPSGATFVTEDTFVDANLPTNAAVLAAAKKELHGITQFRLQLSGNFEMATKLVLLLERQGFSIVSTGNVVIDFTSEFTHISGQHKHRAAQAVITKDGTRLFRYELPAENYWSGDDPAEAFANVLVELLKE